MTTNLDIVSQEKNIFSGSIVSLQLTGTLGSMCIQYGHAPLLTKLIPGPVILRKPNNTKEVMYISGGILEVLPKKITILADVVKYASELDEAAANEKIARTRKVIKNSGSQKIADVQLELAKAIAQLRVIQELRNKDE